MDNDFKGLCKAALRRRLQEEGGRLPENIEHIVDDQWSGWVGPVAAVLRGMREPGEKVWDIGARKRGQALGSGALSIWQAMIDELLRQAGESGEGKADE